MVPLVLTLATPHQRPPGPPQPSLAAFYRRLAAARLPAVPIVSIAGGQHDVQVSLRCLPSCVHGVAAEFERRVSHACLFIHETVSGS